MRLGIEVLREKKKSLERLKNSKVALVAHPASLDHNLAHSVDIMGELNIPLVCAFGPQHGLRGEKQDNMIESDHFTDPRWKIPVYSLYSETRRPTAQMLSGVDVVLFDLQDLGCRIYTFITTLRYFIEECAKQNKTLIVLDRPNPVGRPVEGLRLAPGWESYVGLGPIPMRYGLTVGELSLWIKSYLNLNLDLEVVNMEEYIPEHGPGFGWPQLELSWVNPSPNAASLNMARCYSGSVLLEATNLSEGRGTTRPLEMVGAPDLPIERILSWMSSTRSEWMEGALIRPCYFEPTFHKHKSQLCSGFQVHVDSSAYSHERFKPYRLFALFLKAIKSLDSHYDLWRNFVYEYEAERKPIDVIAGGPLLREWIEDPQARCEDLNALLKDSESSWYEERKPFLLY